MSEENQPKSLDKFIPWAIAIVAIVGISFVAMKYIGQDDAQQPKMPMQAAGNEVQRIELSVRGNSYYPNQITVNANSPVEIVADPTMPGCSKTIVIPQFGISKTVQAGDNVIRFTPTKTGKIPFSCSMGMYRGVINVV